MRAKKSPQRGARQAKEYGEKKRENREKGSRLRGFLRGEKLLYRKTAGFTSLAITDIYIIPNMIFTYTLHSAVTIKLVP
jgi:hypothetical protein